MRWVAIFFSLFCFHLSADSFDAEEEPRIKIIKFDEELSDYSPYLRGYKSIDNEFKKYFLEFHGFPVDKELAFYFKRVVQKNKTKWQKLKEKIVLKSSGMIVIDNQPTGHLFFLSGRGFIPGERLRLRFEEAESHFSCEVSLIPQPLQVRNRAKALIMDAELLSVGPTCYAVNFPGFATNEPLTVLASSGQEAGAPINQPASNQLLIHPDVEGKAGGIAELNVSRKRQKFKMNLPWGAALVDYLEKTMFYRS